MKQQIALVFFILLWFPSLLQAQEKGSGEKIPVQAIIADSKYPPETKERLSAGSWLSDLIFGKADPEINKPVFAIRDDEGTLWILNQGNGQVSHTRKKDNRLSIACGGETFPSLVAGCNIRGKGIAFTDSYLGKVFVANKNDPKEKALLLVEDLQQPTGIAHLESRNEIWIVETAAHRVAVYSDDGKLVKHVGGRGTSNGLFNFPTHICSDSEDRMYVVDAMNFRIQVFSPDGDFLTSFGKQGNVSGSMARPKGIAVDEAGHIYVADALFNAVQVFDSEGNFLFHFGDSGDESQLQMPMGVPTDIDGKIYIADSYNNRIEIYRHEIKE